MSAESWQTWPPFEPPVVVGLYDWLPGTPGLEHGEVLGDDEAISTALQSVPYFATPS